MSDGRIGPYRLIRKLSQGGMGTVYEAVHEAIERRVAIKILKSTYTRNPDAVIRFFNEARAVNRIDHPGLVQVFDHGQLPDGAAYIVMELLKGETMGRRVRRAPGSLSLHQTLRLMRQVAETLAAAHEKEIVHRDLKLDNIMVVPDSAMPDGERTKLLDFGIAKLQARSSSLASTRQDQLMGTPGYMSPEQCRGAAGVDDRSDVYSLGVVLYRLLAGRMPFVASGPGEIMAMHIYEEPPPLKLFGEWVPDAVAAFTHQLLAKEKAERPPMVEVVAAIDRLIAEVPDAKPVVSVLPSAVDESGQGAVSSLDHELGDDSDSGDSDSVMPTVDAGSLESGSRSAVAAQQSHTPSTLAGSVGQQRTLFQPAQLRSLALVVGGALSLLSVGGLYWQRRHLGPFAQPPAATSVASAAPVVVSPVAPVAAPRIVRWSVYTEPPGATVVRVSDGRVLGQTPWQSEQEASPGSEELRLRLAGHVERLIRLERGSDATRHDVLEAVASAEDPAHSPTPEIAPKSKHEHEHKKPRNVAIEFED